MLVIIVLINVIILILVGLALCLTVAAQEKAKTTNVQGYALAIDNAFYSFKESTKAFTDQNSRRGFDMQFFFTQKAGYPIMGIANIAGTGMILSSEIRRSQRNIRPIALSY